MTERLPYDKFVFADGFFGDLILRETYTTSELHECIINKDRKQAIEILYNQYRNGLHTFMPTMEKWKSVINAGHIENFSTTLKHDIYREIYNTYSENFVTSYVLKNRVRRGISSLPRLIFGRKGTVITPFCDFEFVQKALSIPIEFKLNQSLYKALLERSKPGLSNIASTNTKDAAKLKPYLVNPLSDQSWRGQIVSVMREHYPRLHRVLKGIKNIVSENGDSVWVREVFEDPPLIFMDVLTPELKQAIKSGNVEYIKRYHFFLEKIMLLDRFFRR